VNQLLLDKIWRRAQSRCEYCRIPHPQYKLPFQIDHIIARKHNGPSTLDNLALACFHCNRFKGPNIAGFDGDPRQPIRLFHPRNDIWGEHFFYQDAWLIGRTPIGRVTIKVLAMNADNLLSLRSALLQEGIRL
jgi:hypothetical protein